MPKEQINTPVRQFVTKLNNDEVSIRGLREDAQDGWPDDAKNSHIEYTPVVYIGWPSSVFNETHPDANVKITMEISEEVILREADRIRKAREEAPDWPDRDNHVWYDRMIPFSTLLITRNEWNNLIKVIRRARDTAYGSDE